MYRYVNRDAATRIAVIIEKIGKIDRGIGGLNCKIMQAIHAVMLAIITHRTIVTTL